MATQSITRPKRVTLPAWLRNRWVLITLAVLLIAAIVIATVLIRAKTAVTYETSPVVQQTLTQSVTASGTVSPQNEVTVGTQVSGTISALYVDYNSKVTKGEVLARIDTSTFQAQLDQAQANLAQAQAQAAAQADAAVAANAGIPSANATVAKAQSALKLAQTNLTRDQSLLKQGFLAASQVQADQDAANAAQAGLATAQAGATQASATAGGGGNSLAAAQASVAAQQAAVQQDQLNLNRAVITSPVDGTVIDREISVGQTVAASLQTPTLFTIAQNLKQMQVNIAVGEPDIGSVRAGENVTFTVLAYPGRTYKGTVVQVRDNPVTTSNVVTYTVVTSVSNPDGSLLPGMTANATIQIASAPNALVVPTSALHVSSANGGAASPWGQTSSAAGVAPQAGNTATVMVMRNGKTSRATVKVELVSGAQAAVTVVSGTLAAGDDVVTGSSNGTVHTTRARSGGSAFGGPGGGLRGIH
jgi:HlyD family secretion protein